MDTLLRRFAASDAVTDGFAQMDADFRIEFIFAPLAAEPLEFNVSHSCLSESRMLTIATLLLCAAALLTSWIPAARAASVAPMGGAE